MGRIQRKRPRRGSLAYAPHIRAHRDYPQFRFGTTSRLLNLAPKNKPLGFVGYKAGMISVSYVNPNKNSPQANQEVVKAASVLEIPPVEVVGVRLYKNNLGVLQVSGEKWAEKIPKELQRVLPEVKERKKFDDKLFEGAEQIRLLVCTNPSFKKTPEILEIPINGNVSEVKEHALSLLGGQLKFSDVFSEGQYVDVIGVTKGKGFSGVVKRFGVKMLQHKSEKSVRKVASLGNWMAHTWRVAHPGKHGFYTRTEMGKKVLKVVSDSKERFGPAGGFVKYGFINSDYVILEGSIPGAKKRAVLLRQSLVKRVSQPTPLTSVILTSQQ